MSATNEMKFFMKYVIEDVSKMDKEVYHDGDKERHFNVPWRVYVLLSDEVCVFIECLKFGGSTQEWSINTDITVKIISENGEEKVQDISFNFTKEESDSNIANFAFVEGDKRFIVEVHVTITGVTGFRTTKLRSFDESMEKFSDVTLVVKGQKFYVSKLFLASHSTYFESLFLGNFDESGKKEVEINSIDPNDFQEFLELINGESFVDEDNVEGILHLADFFDAKTALKRCEKFLLEDSERSNKDKFELAVEYELDDVMIKCISDMTTKEDVMAKVPDDPEELSKSTWAVLFNKLASFS
ncbi:hypothetical protein CRE_21308 [Caenorhabditis remanei]|uniref:BTB domain-containing protein n=1 Tax=Caenorhabditis remanei TaxID=31234 RepID=E3MUL6_CAERE|nr:hypothetical protein CRE_21308 [Caenorhabditis remanei]